MTWFKVDDHLHAHRKTMRAGTEAMGLWVIAGSWSAAELSDGWVPDYAVARLVGANGLELAAQLVRAGLWDEDELDGESGYRFRGWGEYQPLRAKVERNRHEQAERQRVRRAGGVRTNNASSSRPPSRPDPTNNNTTRKRAASVSDDDPDWSAFWAAYPRKVGKGAARTAWAKALRTETPATIIRAAEAFALSVRGADPQYVAHPATWLNRESWSDELLPSGEAAAQHLPAWTPPTPPREYDNDPAGGVAWQREQRRLWLEANGATA